MGCIKKRSILTKVPSACRDVIQHKWSKADKPQKVAKIYGIKSFDRIWNTKSNEKLRKLRRTPDGLKAGDLVAIPFAEKDKMLLVDKALEYNKMSDNFNDYALTVARKIIRIEKIIAYMDKQINILLRKKYDEKNEAKLTSELSSSASKISKLIQSIPNSKSPLAYQFKLVPLIREAIKGDKVTNDMENGKDLDKQLKVVEKIIINKRKEIKVLRDRLKDMQNELNQDGYLVIADICKVKTLQRLRPMLEKDFK